VAAQQHRVADAPLAGEVATASLSKDSFAQTIGSPMTPSSDTSLDSITVRMTASFPAAGP
jgi:hypothetical protein